MNAELDELMIQPKRLACMTFAILLTASVAHATLPVVNSLSPLGVVRGSETVVTFNGVRVSDAYDVLCDVPGITIIDVKAIDAKKVEVKLKTAKDLAPGLYPVRLVCKGGIANLRLLGVGAMPITKEAEPNSKFDEPQQIEMNHTIEGVVDREDIDYYQVKLKKDEVLNVEIEGIRLAYSTNNQNILDPFVAILDEGRFEVASSDDAALLQQDAFCSFKAPQDGTYTVVVRDSSFRGNPICGYRLHVGTFPRPVAVFPGGGVPGATVKANLINEDGSKTQASLKLPSETVARWPVATENKDGISPSPNWIRVNELPIVTEQEPNNDYKKAPEYTVPAAFCGVIGEAKDYDCFSFTGVKGTNYRVEVFARNVLRSPLDAYCNVFGPDNKTIKSSDDGGGARVDPIIDFTAPAAGKYTVRLYDHLRSGSDLHAYRIEVTMPPPTFAIKLKELRRYEPQVANVPAGGQIGMVLNTTRTRYNGELRFELDSLPEGITATTFPMPPGRNEIPVLLSATADATHIATLFTIKGRGDDKNKNVVGTLSQHHGLVLGQNGREMWGYETKRAAMAVTDKAPFTIELVQPKTPILRSGSKSLLVKIVRDEGFDGEVQLRTLYNPPGVGINNSQRIRKGKTEVAVPITANSKAAVGKWPLILTASYPTKLGTAYLSTKPIMLDVQDSLFKYVFKKASGELGAETSITLDLEVVREYQGEAEVELVGLPKGTSSTAAKQKISKDTKTLTFPVLIGKDAKVAKHRTLNCVTRVKVGDETMVQTNGTGEIRIDKPLPPETDENKVVQASATKKTAVKN